MSGAMSSGPKDRQRGEANRLAADCVLRLRLLATTDLHATVFPWDYAAAKNMPHRGLVGLAPVIALARSECPNTLLFDNGDVLQGSALGDLYAQDANATTPHPVIAAMNALQFDAGTLGNHDFSHGIKLLRRALDGANFPIVSANVRMTEPRTAERALVQPHALITRVVRDETGRTHLLRIGVTGVLPSQTALWERSHLEGKIHVDDIINSLKLIIYNLRALGADLVVVLAHSGIGAATPEDDPENAALQIAGLAGVDAVIMGHAHQVFPSDFTPHIAGVDPIRGTLAGKPAVMPGPFGSSLGVIDLLLDQHGPNDAWRVVTHRVQVRPAESVPETPPLFSPEVQAAHRRALDWVQTRIGRVDRRLSTHFALVAPCPALRILAQAKVRHVAEALDGGAFGHIPVLAAVAPFKAGGFGGPDNFTLIEPGDVLLRHLIDLCPHPNTVTALRVSGADIADWLERAVGIFRRLTPGEADQPLIEADFPAFNFDLIDGLEFRIDLTQPARFDARGGLAAPQAQRIVDLRWQGAPIPSDMPFILATNSHRASGGAGFAGTGKDNIILDDGTPVREALVRYIRARGTQLPPSMSGWEFVPMPQTSATFLSSPLADIPPHLANNRVIQRLEMTADGFQRFRLHL